MATDLVRTPDPRQSTLADGKFSGAFLMFRDVPGVADIAGTPDEITAKWSAATLSEVENRYTALSDAREQALKTRGRPQVPTPGPLYLILDEYLNWILPCRRRTRKDIIAKYTRIGSIGREVDCALVIATQRPGTQEVDTGLPGLLKAQLKCRVAIVGAARAGLDRDADGVRRRQRRRPPPLPPRRRDGQGREVRGPVRGAVALLTRPTRTPPMRTGAAAWDAPSRSDSRSDRDSA